MVDLPTLYPDQQELLDRVRWELQQHRRVILCGNPGFGKTVMAKWILGAGALREPTERQTGYGLFAVQRRGLVDNASNSFNEEPRVRHGLIMSDRKPAYGARVQVASIDTLLSWFIKDGQYDTSISFDLIVYDECVSGDSVVETDLGAMRIDQIPQRKPSTVKTYSPERGVHFARILNWMPKGCRHTLDIHTHAGIIRCTPEHEIYTRRGWLPAQFVFPTDEILACAGAERPRGRADCSGGGTGNVLPASSSPHSGKSCAGTRRRVVADAGIPHGRRSSLSRRGSPAAASRFTTSMLTDTPTAERTRLCDSRRSNLRRYSAPCLETPRSAIPIRSLGRRDSTARMGTSRRNGPSTRRSFCTASTPAPASRITRAGVNSRLSRPRRAIQPSSRSTISSSGVAGSGYLGRGSIQLGTSVLRGGSATTGAWATKACSSTRKGTPSVRTRLSRTGSATTSARPRSAAPRTPTSSISPVGRRSKLAIGSPDTSRSACGTSWSRVTRIVPASLEVVYDIEVEGSHCFFANNLLVHNCHAHLPKLVKFLQHHERFRRETGKHPAYVLGLSATPECKGLADVYRTIVTGRSTQWLIDNKRLSPYRYFGATQGRLGLLVRKGDDFTEDSVSKAMAGLSGALVRDWKRFAEGRPTVGFFPRRQHAQEAKAELEAAGLRVAYVDGETDDTSRARMFWELGNGKLDYLCNVQVVERGTDIPAIGCVQLCVAVGSVVRYRQMIGRGSRVHPEKDSCLVLDHGGNIKRHGFFEDDPQWTLDHSKGRVGDVKARPTIECPKCKAIYRGGKCRNCGYEPTKQEYRGQGLEFDGTELREIQVEQKPQRVLGPEELMVEMMFAAGRSGRTWKQCVGMFSRAAKAQGTPYSVPRRVTIAGRSYRTLEYNHEDGGRKVGSLFPVTVGKGHGGRYLEREQCLTSAAKTGA